MKTLVLLLVCELTIAGSAQQSLKTFTSPDGLLRFQHSDMLVKCIPRQTTAGLKESGTSQANHPTPPVSDSCVSPEALCGSPGSNGNTLACFAYPKEKFKDKPHFLAATFFVSEIRSAKTEAECVSGSPDWLVVNSKPEIITINGTAFKTFEIEDNWAGGGRSGPVHRTFHHDRCYELGIQIAISRAEYDPGTVKEFTPQDRADVEGRLGQALSSFVFLK
jgi:hypothetical protein